MAASTPRTSTLPAQRRRIEEERTFQLLFLCSFPVFLAVALSARVLPGAKSSDDPGARRGSLLAEAASVARSTIAIALTD